MSARSYLASIAANLYYVKSDKDTIKSSQDKKQMVEAQLELVSNAQYDQISRAGNKVYAEDNASGVSGLDNTNLGGRPSLENDQISEMNSRYDENNPDGLIHKMVTRFKAVLFKVKINTYHAIVDYILFILLYPCAKWCRCLNGPYDRVHVL